MKKLLIVSLMILVTVSIFNISTVFAEDINLSIRAEAYGVPGNVGPATANYTITRGSSTVGPYFLDSYDLNAQGTWVISTWRYDLNSTFTLQEWESHVQFHWPNRTPSSVLSTTLNSNAWEDLNHLHIAYPLTLED